MNLRNWPLLQSLALGSVLALPGCLNVVPQNGICGLSSLSGSMAFPVRAGMAFHDPQAQKYVVWLWDEFDAGAGNDNSNYAEDWVSWCGAIADAGFNSGERLPQRLLLLSLSPPLAGVHAVPTGTGQFAMSASFYQQGQSGGLSASASKFDVSTTVQCVSGPLTLTFGQDAGASVLSGTIDVPYCGPAM
jgi:hypothetical protein